MGEHRHDLTLSGAETIAHAREQQVGFLTREQVQTIAQDQHTRLEPILVRCGGGRFTAPAQDVLHFADIIEKHARDYRHPGLSSRNALNLDARCDYIRDFSLPATR